ncbi:major prion protein homolog [Dendropsophus ebraccatus]|uniref:major prion protein homolog n=1 Tax=Dendropsophus ebraccatus TaxID=150705 RepID=UPI003831830F
MAKTFWIQLALISVLILTVASKKGGKSKGGGWSSGTNRNPSYPGNTGSNWNPSHPGNTGGNWNPHYPANPGSNWNTGGGWGNNYNPGGSNYNKQFKPPKSKTNMKMVAAGVGVGALGGFMLGNAVSNMRYSFANDMDSRYYDSYRNQMPDRIYRPMYRDNTYVTEDRFVSDCYNTSMTEYKVTPIENATDADQTEIRVKSTVIRQLCVTEYRRAPEYGYGYGKGMNLLVSPGFILFIALFVYFMVE